MTKEEIHERFRTVLERALAKPLEECTPMPVFSTVSQRVRVDQDSS